MGLMVSDKDFDRMEKIINSKNSNLKIETVANKITNKAKAIARYAAGVAVDEIYTRRDCIAKGRYTFIHHLDLQPLLDKAKELGATQTEIDQAVRDAKGRYSSEYQAQEAKIAPLKQAYDTKVENERKAKEEAERKAQEAEEAFQEKLKTFKAGRNTSQDEIDKFFNELIERFVPYSGKADTLAGECLRAYQYIEYRYYNDGDWFNASDGLGVSNPKSAASKSFLSHYVPQISYYYKFGQGSIGDMFANWRRAIVAKCVKEDYFHVSNSMDSRSVREVFHGGFVR